MTILSKKFLRRSVRKLSLLLLRFQCQLYNLLLLNWQLLGVEMKLGQAHKTRFWYRLGVFSKFSDEHPRHLYKGVPPGVKAPPPHNTRHPDFLRVPLLASVKAKSGFFFSVYWTKTCTTHRRKEYSHYIIRIIWRFRFIKANIICDQFLQATTSHRRPPIRLLSKHQHFLSEITTVDSP